MGTEMVAFLESVLSGLDCLDCLAEKGKNPKVSGRAVSTSVDVLFLGSFTAAPLRNGQSP